MSKRHHHCFPLERLWKKYEMAILPGIRTLYKQDVALACERLEGILSGRVRQGTEPTKCSI